MGKIFLQYLNYCDSFSRFKGQRLIFGHDGYDDLYFEIAFFNYAKNNLNIGSLLSFKIEENTIEINEDMELFADNFKCDFVKSLKNGEEIADFLYFLSFPASKSYAISKSQEAVENALRKSYDYYIAIYDSLPAGIMDS